MTGPTHLRTARKISETCVVPVSAKFTPSEGLLLNHFLAPPEGLLLDHSTPPEGLLDLAFIVNHLRSSGSKVVPVASQEPGNRIEWISLKAPEARVKVDHCWLLPL